MTMIGSKQTKHWTMKDGTKIRICDMSDEHLKNALKMLYRMSVRELENLPFPCFSPDSMAQYYAEQGFDEMMTLRGGDLIIHYHPIADALFDDAYRRGMQPEEWWN